ncbi:MAG: outer membrane beta-barrel protein [Bacteroidales bacterium]
MKEKDFIELYRNQVESLNETPPDSCWDEINTQLDIEETWDSVSMELDNVLPSNNDFTGALTDKKLVTFSKLALLITPLLLILLVILSDTRETQLISSEISAIDSSEASITQTIIPKSSTSIPPESEQLAEEAEDISKGLPAQEPNNTSPPDAAVNATNHSYISVKNDVITTGQPVLLPFVVKPSRITIPVSKTAEVTDNKSTGNGFSQAGGTFKSNRFSIGISLTEKNTWLISQETIDGFDRQELGTTKVTFLNDFGIILRYTMNERWSFEGTCLLLSKTGQSYDEYIYGIYSSKIYELNYLSFEMSARYALRRSFNINRVRSHFVGGAYISHLNKAYKTIDYSVSDISTDFDPIDYGVLLGYELDIKIIDHFAITPGIRIKCGIPNIFGDQPGIPDDLHSTRNASMEFRLNFIFPF